MMFSIEFVFIMCLILKIAMNSGKNSTVKISLNFPYRNPQFQAACEIVIFTEVNEYI